MRKNIDNAALKNIQFFVNPWVIAILFLVISIICILLFLVVDLWSPNSDNKHVAQVNNIKYMRPLSENDYYRWKSPSKYTLVIYESMDCKYCHKLNTYINTHYDTLYGKFNLAYRNAPLTGSQPLAAEKALIAECVYQDRGSEKLFEFMNDVYNNYKTLHTNNDWIKERAKKYLIDPAGFIVCLNSKSAKEKIATDVQNLIADGIKSTPSIGIYYDSMLVWRYSAWYNGTIRVMQYLSTFDENADQFWSDELYNAIQKK